MIVNVSQVCRSPITLRKTAILIGAGTRRSVSSMLKGMAWSGPRRTVKIGKVSLLGLDRISG